MGCFCCSLGSCRGRATHRNTHRRPPGRGAPLRTQRVYSRPICTRRPEVLPDEDETGGQAVTISRADEQLAPPKRTACSMPSRTKPANRPRHSSVTAYRSHSPRSTRDTERVEMLLTPTKQRFAYRSTRDTSNPIGVHLPSACRMADANASVNSFVPCRAISDIQSMASNLIVKGGTAYQPLTHVNCRKQKQLKNQGRNVPVQLLFTIFPASPSLFDFRFAPPFPVAGFQSADAIIENRAYGRAGIVSEKLSDRRAWA